MQFNPMLSFNGTCQAAFKFYQEVLGGDIQTMMTWGESPMADQVSPEFRDKIVHANLTIGDAALLGSDSPPDSYEPAKGISVTIQLKEAAEGKRIFGALSQGGTVQMPFEPTFWAAGFGMCVDRFGIPWMVNCGQPGQ